MALEYDGVEADETDAAIVFDQLEAAGYDALEASDMIDQVVMAGGDLDDLLDMADGVESELEDDDVDDVDRDEFGISDDDWNALYDGEYS